MAKGGFPGFGGNMQNILKQAQKMQKDMEKAQEELSDIVVDVSVGGGAVTVVATAKKEIKEIKVKPELLDPEDPEMLQDLLVVAVNEVLKKADDVAASKMGNITGGMGGLF